MPQLLTFCRAPAVLGDSGHPVPVGHQLHRDADVAESCVPAGAPPSQRSVPGWHRYVPEQRCCVGTLHHSDASPWREQQSPLGVLMAQLANPLGSVWEEMYFLNVLHY